MDEYHFGEIFDARQVPTSDYGILGEHFWLIAGENKQHELMYYVVTSRVYAVFRDVLEYFNDCIDRNDKYFLRAFSKERDKNRISRHGNLSDAMFLDRYNDYPLQLDVDSMILINSDPLTIDRSVVESLKQEKLLRRVTRLTDSDIENFRRLILFSKNVSPTQKNMMMYCYNRFKKTKGA